MQLKDPTRQARLQKDIDELYARYAQAKPLVEHFTTLKQNADALKASANAAETDAERVRGEVRELLTKLIGRPNKELRAKNAEQRAAIELAEDYRELCADMQDDITVAELAANLPACDTDYQRGKLLNTYCELLLEEAVNEIAPQLRYSFRRLRDTMYFTTSDERLVADLAGTTYDELVFRFISQAISRAMKNAAPVTEPPEVLEVLQACPRYNIKKITPGMRQNIQFGLDKRRKEREAQVAARKAL